MLTLRHAAAAALPLLCIFSAPLTAAEPIVPAPPERPRTCLVLGGGGARGAAHIGVLKVLERERIPVDCVVGTSMGAIVGGLYASGFSADEIQDVLEGIDWNDIFQDDPSREERSIRRKEDDLRFLGGVEVGLKEGKIALPKGMVQGQKLLLTLRRLLLPVWNVQDFDDLPLPYRSVAADIVTGEKVVFGEGDLAMAIRASMSVPGAFAPIRVNGRLLVDGGMVDNVPVDEARKLGAERLIVVSVGSPMLEEDELTSPFAIANQMITALMGQRTAQQLSTLDEGDVLVVPELGKFSAARFDLAAEAVKIGFEAADRATPQLQRFAVTDAEYARFRERHEVPSSDDPTVAFVDVQADHGRNERYLEHHLDGHVGKPLDVSALEKDIGVAFGEGSYEAIRWNLAQSGADTGVRVESVNKAWGPNFLRFGLQLSDDFDGRSAYQLRTLARFTGLNDYGGEVDAWLQVGRILNGHVEFHQPWGWASQYSVAPYLDYRALNIPLRVEPRDENFFAEIRRSEFVAGLELGWNLSNKIRVSSAVETGHEDAHIQVGLPIGTDRLDVGRVRLRFEYDSLDEAAFPSRGMRFDVSEELYAPELRSDQSADVTRLNVDTAFSFGENRFMLGLKLALANGGDELLGTFSTLGGLANVSGYTDNEIVARQLGFARAVYYRRLTHPPGPFSVPFYAGASIEAAGWWEERDAADIDDLLPAGSVFVGLDSVLGPVFLGYGRAEGGIDSFYLRFGPLLRPESRL